MRQPQRNPPPRRQPDELPPLRDPSEGQVPAVIEAESGVDPQEAAAAFPQFIPPPCRTIGDEQRERSAEIEAMGVEAWKDAHDSRTEEEKADAQLQVAGVRSENIDVIKTGGGRLPYRESADAP